MDPTTENRHELGVRVRQRRLRLGLSIGKAAKEAPMSPTTWSRVEHGGTVRELAYSSIDAVLKWREGACERYLRDGEEPEAAEAAETGAAGGEVSPRQKPGGAPPARATAAKGGPHKLPGRRAGASLSVSEIREWRTVPTSVPDSEETTIVFWSGPANVDMDEVGRAFDELRHRRTPAREAAAIAEQDRWEAIIAREKADAARAANGDREE
ncbi:helix-turn-helix domain-containing protein [Actinomadura rugatobispora]|uniref:Helix-turn-helix domain-containing protein n=1 Tax=Actinomadura rugatobispora TaxID=1994 RepID=A0ABW1A6G0_9ACTN|nr:hypothetical protein GCM10010200_026200 [Actinomadura rugatobispora]